MKKILSRRDFLKVSGVAASAAAAMSVLASCGGDNSNDNANNSQNEIEEIEGNTEKTVVNEKVTEDTTVSSSANRFDKVTIAVSEAISTLSGEGGIKGGTSSPVADSMMESLFIVEDGEYVPLLAKSYEVVDGTHWNVTIYDYIKDGEGNAITADDVVYSYEYFKANGTIPKFDLFAGIEKIDEYTVQFTWTEEPTAILALEHIWCGTAVVSQKAHESHTFATDPVGTGPYTLSSFTTSVSVVVEARDDYWQTDDLRLKFAGSNVQTMQFDCITEAAQRVIALETETVDFSASVAFDSLATFQDGGSKGDLYDIDIRSGGSIVTLNPNCDPISPCSDINLRLAIFYALNNEGIATGYPAGGASAAKGLGTDYYIGYDNAWNDEENYITTYDVEKAKEYLDKSSYNGETLIILTQSGNLSTVAEIIQNMLLEININTDIRAYDYATWLSTQGKPENFDLIILSSGGSGPFIGLGWNRPFTVGDWGTGKTIGYADDPTLTELLNTIKTTDGATAENIEAMRSQWMDNAYTYPMYDAKSFNVYNSNKFATLFYNCDGNLVPNACTYIMD